MFYMNRSVVSELKLISSEKRLGVGEFVTDLIVHNYSSTILSSNALLEYLIIMVPIASINLPNVLEMHVSYGDKLIFGNYSNMYFRIL